MITFKDCPLRIDENNCKASWRRRCNAQRCDDYNFKVYGVSYAVRIDRDKREVIS